MSGTPPQRVSPAHPLLRVLQLLLETEGRNVTAITSPVVLVSGTKAATQLTFRLKTATCTDTPHLKRGLV